LWLTGGALLSVVKEIIMIKKLWLFAGSRIRTLKLHAEEHGTNQLS
jgi:hypothetical protein